MGQLSIVVLTGAGISAESGLQTFRAADGVWCGHRVEDVATPEAFARNPALVHEFYNLRRKQLKEAQPNVAHVALAEFALKHAGEFLLVTQNIDDLHDRAHESLSRAPAHYLTHMHGELRKVRCQSTEAVVAWEEDLLESTPCTCCQINGCLRPHIVWFGEMPLDMPRIERALASCDLFVSIGTSGNVYPAAGFVQMARMAGARTVELNLEPSLGSRYFDECHHGPATKVVGEFFREI